MKKIKETFNMKTRLDEQIDQGYSKYCKSADFRKNVSTTKQKKGLSISK